jgi:hypothetical protein
VKSLANKQGELNMKAKFHVLVALAVVGLFLVAAVVADTPTVNITSPTAGTTLFSSTFPFQTPVTFTVQHSGAVLDALKDLLLTYQKTTDATPTTIYSNADPFPSNACPSLVAPLTGCTVTDSHNGSMTVTWSIPSPGDYAITVEATHGNNTGDDTEEPISAVLIVSAEFPAPPAVANAYINSDPSLKSLIGKRRGCVISKIAEQHAKYETYGPKGGPYNEAAIQSDVNAFSSPSVCP